MSKGPWVYREGYGIVTKDRAREIDARNAKPRAKVEWLPRRVERGSWVFRDGKLIPKHEAVAQRMKAVAHAKSAHPAPAIRSDQIEIKSMIDGRMYDSKSAYYKHVEKSGHFINDDKTPPSPAPPVLERNPEAHKKNVIGDIVEAFQKHEQGWQEPPLENAYERGIDVADADSDGFIRADADKVSVD